MTQARIGRLWHERRGHHLLGAGRGDRDRSTPTPRACPARPDGLDEDLLQVLLHVDYEREQVAPGRYREVGDDEVDPGELGHAAARQIRLHDLRDRAAAVLSLEQERERAVAHEVRTLFLDLRG